MKQSYRDGEYVMGLSPNGNQWLIHRGKLCVATIDRGWAERRMGHGYDPMQLLREFLEWYYQY